MSRSMAVVVIGSMFLGGGCVRDEVPPEIEKAILEMHKTCTDNVQMAGKKMSEVSRRIWELGDPYVKQACCRRWTEEILRIDPDKIDRQHRGYYLGDAVHCGLGVANILDFAGASKEESWCVRIKLLSYARRHIRRLRASLQAQSDVNWATLKNRQTYRVYCNAVWGYNHAARMYEVALVSVETCFDVRGLSEDAKESLRKKLEDFLGRPMRTYDQCMNYYRKNVAMEFLQLRLPKEQEEECTKSVILTEPFKDEFEMDIDVEFPDEKPDSSTGHKF